MEALVWSFVAIVTVDILLVAWFAVRELIDRRGTAREIQQLDAIWRAAQARKRPPLRERRLSSSGAGRSAERRRAAATLPAVGIRTVPRRPDPAWRRRARVAVVALAAAVAMAVVGPPLRRAIVPEQRLADPPAERASGPSSERREDDAHSVSDDLLRIDPQGNGRVDEAPGSSSITASHRRTAPEAVAVEPRSSTTIRLVWAEVPQAIGYLVQRWEGDASAMPPSWVKIATVPGGATAFTDVGLESDTTYFYRVSAVSEDGSSPPSDVVSATTLPAPPTATVAAASANGNAVTVTWIDVPDETGYRIERSPDGTTDWTTIGTHGQDVTAHSDGGLTPGVTYHYRVIATNEGGESPPSNVVSVTVPEEQEEAQGTGSGSNGAMGEESPSPSLDGAAVVPS